MVVNAVPKGWRVAGGKCCRHCCFNHQTNCHLLVTCSDDPVKLTLGLYGMLEGMTCRKGHLQYSLILDFMRSGTQSYKIHDKIHSKSEIVLVLIVSMKMGNIESTMLNIETTCSQLKLPLWWCKANLLSLENWLACCADQKSVTLPNWTCYALLIRNFLGEKLCSVVWIQNVHQSLSKDL